MLRQNSACTSTLGPVTKSNATNTQTTHITFAWPLNYLPTWVQLDSCEYLKLLAEYLPDPSMTCWVIVCAPVLFVVPPLTSVMWVMLNKIHRTGNLPSLLPTSLIWVNTIKLQRKGLCFNPGNETNVFLYCSHFIYIYFIDPKLWNYWNFKNFMVTINKSVCHYSLRHLLLY